jgi:hypothetical protein
VIQTAVEKFYDSLEFYRQREQPSSEDIRNIIEILERPSEEVDTTINYQLWEYADRNLEINFRDDLCYENPDDLIDTLETLESEPDSRETTHSLKPLNLISEKLVESL